MKTLRLMIGFVLVGVIAHGCGDDVTTVTEEDPLTPSDTASDASVDAAVPDAGSDDASEHSPEPEPEPLDGPCPALCDSNQPAAPVVCEDAGTGDAGASCTDASSAGCLPGHVYNPEFELCVEGSGAPAYATCCYRDDRCNPTNPDPEEPVSALPEPMTEDDECPPGGGGSVGGPGPCRFPTQYRKCLPYGYCYCSANP